MSGVQPEAGEPVRPSGGVPGPSANRDEVERAQEVTDRHRERARSAATILATVAGALVVALFSAATLEGHTAARAWGMAAAVLLLLASGQLILASVAGARARGAGWRIAFWTLRANDGAQGGAAVTRQVRRIIGRLTDAAMVVAGLGLLSLLVAMALFVVAPADASTVTVTFTGAPPVAAPCGRLAQTVQGTVDSAQLDEDTPFLLLQLAGRSCRGAEGLTVLLDKTDVTVVRG